MKGEYRAVIALEGFATESCILTCLEMTKLHKITHHLLCENVENHATFAEGFCPEFYARGRFIKYSLSAETCPSKKLNLRYIFFFFCKNSIIH